MKRKHIDCRSNCKDEWNVREVIKSLLSILDDSLDVPLREDGSENYELENQIDITVCGKTARIGYFCPNTWAYTEEFLMKTIGFLIVCYELNEFPYYAEILERMTKGLGCTAEDLDVM